MKQSRITQGAWIENLKRAALITFTSALRHNEQVEKSGEGKKIELVNEAGKDIVQVADQVIAQFERVQKDAELCLNNLKALDRATGFAGKRKPESIVFYVRFEGDEQEPSKVTSEDTLVLEDARAKYSKGEMTIGEFVQILEKITAAKK